MRTWVIDKSNKAEISFPEIIVIILGRVYRVGAVLIPKDRRVPFPRLGVALLDQPEIFAAPLEGNNTGVRQYFSTENSQIALSIISICTSRE